MCFALAQRKTIAYLRCVQCHVNYMTLDALKISCQITPFCYGEVIC